MDPNISGKHARWWTKVYGSGLKEVSIIHRSGKESSNVNALSRNPCGPAPTEGIGESEIQVASIRNSVECASEADDISVLLNKELEPTSDNANPEVLALEQKRITILLNF